MKDTRNQTNNTTNKQSSKRSNYLLVKGAMVGIVSTLLLILLISLIFYVRLRTLIIDANLKSACSTLIFFLPIFLLTREKEKSKSKTE